MSLDEFKTIYWWEWTHRLLARLDRRGVPAAVPVFPLARLDRAAAEDAAVDAVRRRRACWARSAGGWCRRVSPARVSVSQYRLAFHLTLACAIYAAILWTARGLAPQRGGAPCRGGCGSTASGLAVAGAAADLSRRAGRRARRGARLQHLAADRRRADPVRRAAVVRERRRGAICSRTR